MSHLWTDGRTTPEFYCGDCNYVKVNYDGGLCATCQSVRQAKMSGREKITNMAWGITVSVFVIVLGLYYVVFYAPTIPVGN